MTPNQYAYILAGCFCIVVALLILAMRWDRYMETRQEERDERNGVRLVEGLELLRETPVALELAEPPGSVYIARSSLLLGQRVLTPAGTLIVPPWRQPLTAQLAVQQAGIGETTGVFARIIADHTGSAPETFGPREADLHPLYLDVT